MKIIGLAGYARAGKDSVGKILVEQHGFERRSFADTIRACLWALNPVCLVVLSAGTVLQWRVQDVVDAHGWEWTKTNTDVRDLLQRLGTDVGRNLLGPDIWVDTTMSLVEAGGRYVFTDVRFPNEARAIRDRGGEVWRVERFGYGPANGHVSEVAIDEIAYDHRIANHSTLENLVTEVHAALYYGRSA